MSAIVPSASEMGNVSPRIVLTSRSFSMYGNAEIQMHDIPQVEQILLVQGLSQAILGSKASCAAFVNGFAFGACGSSGLPGVKCMTTKIISDVAKRVGINQSNRSTA